MSKLFEQEIIRYIVAYDMISSGDKVIVGVSGGKDSVTLLNVLSGLSKDWGFGLYAVHVNHMLRGEASEKDKEFVKALCEKMNIPCMAVSVNVQELADDKGISVEEAGRLARYKIFDEAARKAQGDDRKQPVKIALGHHRDDNVETILLNMVRGASLNGITGMMAVRERGDFTYIRPLLCVGREDISKYADTLHLEYVDDVTNFSDEYSRNKIRLNVIPELQKVNSKAVEHIDDTADRLYELQEYIEKKIQEGMSNIVDRRDDKIALDVFRLKAEEPAIRTGVVHRCIGQMAGTLKDISHVHVRDVISLMDKQTGRQIELPYGIVASRSYSNIMLSRKSDSPGRSWYRADYDNNNLKMNLTPHVDISISEIKNGGREIVLGDGSKIVFEIIDVDDVNRPLLVQKNFYAKAFDCDTIKGNLILGRPEPDDQIKFAGGTKQLKKYFVDEKIPLEIRNQLVVLKDLNGVLWVLGYRIGEQYKITERTEHALLVTVIGGNHE